MLARLRAPAAHLAAFFASLITMLPVYLITINALKSSPEAATMSIDLPSEFHFENFLIAIEKGKLIGSFLNSLLYAGTATVIATLFSAMAAFAMARHRTMLNRFLYLFLIMGIALPINFFTLTTMMQATHLINTKIGVIILYAALQVPFSVFLIYGFVETIPRELDEAAILDGCRPPQLFFLVILPLLKPVLVTAGILNFLNIWNDFMIPLYYLNSTSHWPMTLAVYNFFGQYQSSWNLVSADILLTIIPVVIVYLLGQRYIIAGMTSGSVKG